MINDYALYFPKQNVYDESKLELSQKVNKNENVRIPNIMVNDKWQWYIESMKKIPKRIINDPPKGWMRPIEMFWELIRFQNTNNFMYSIFDSDF